MLDLLKQVDLLEHLSLAEIILHIVLFDCFDGHLLTSQLMDAQGYLTERSFTDQLHEFVEVESCGR